MKVHNPAPQHEMPSEVKAALATYWHQRQFNARQWIFAKATAINNYMNSGNLSGCVVGLSGGIDSAVVLALLVHAQQLTGSPIQTVLPVSLPVSRPQYASNQTAARVRAQEVADAFHVPLVEVDLKAAHAATKDAVDLAMEKVGDNWAGGQLVATLRTPTLYYCTSVLTASGTSSIVVGTTNRDEGAYLGYVGKSSDGMVDLQPISDLHKSEVRAVAKALGVPASVLDAAPTGDMFDGRDDSETIGADYDFIELYIGTKSNPPTFKTPEAQAYWDHHAASLETMHAYNAHKYAVGSPAVHLDLMPTDVPGGWCRQNWAPTKPPANAVVNLVDYTWPIEVNARVIGVEEPVVAFKGLVTKESCAALAKIIHSSVWVRAGHDGVRLHSPSAKTHSFRQTFFDPAAANALYAAMSKSLNQVFVATAATPDLEAGAAYRVVGVNPLFRVIAYTHDGTLVPHYDAPYKFDAKRQTEMSLVIAIETPPEGSTTTFVEDTRVNAGFVDAQPGEEFPEIADYTLHTGDALLFPHRLFHASLGAQPGKLILRTDIIVEKVC